MIEEHRSKRLYWPASAVDERNYVGGEPLQALDALHNRLAAAIENQLVHADRCEISNVPGDLFLLAEKGRREPSAEGMPVS